MACIQILKPVGPHRVASSTTSTPPLYNAQSSYSSTENSKSENASSTSCIFDVPTSDDNEDFGNLSFSQSNEGDSFSVDVNVEKELNKHSGLIATPTGSTGSAHAGTSRTASMSSACNTSTDSMSSTYEVIPLNPNIVFDPFGYCCVSNKAYESKERKPVFKKCFCLGI